MLNSCRSGSLFASKNLESVRMYWFVRSFFSLLSCISTVARILLQLTVSDRKVPDAARLRITIGSIEGC